MKGKDKLGHIIDLYERWNNDELERVWYCLKCDKQYNYKE